MRALRVLIGLAPLIARARFQTWWVQRRGAPIGDPRRVLFLASFWPGNAGYEYRVARWAEILAEVGFAVDIDCVFEHDQFWRWANDNDVRLYMEPAAQRLRRILDSHDYGTVIVAREILLWNDYGWLFLERLLLAMHPNAILDLDDDLGAAKREPRPISWFGRLLGEHPTKFSSSLRLYGNVIAGSGYLKQLVLERAPQLEPDDVVVIPTCLDYEHERPKTYAARSGPLVFGWIGGTGNLQQLDAAVPALQKIAESIPIRLLVISGAPYTAGSLDVENVAWDMRTHLDHLRRIDIGLMPLRDSAEDRGKCGFKLLQYMGLGIVAVATALTANTEIVDDGVSGFLVEPDGDWEPALQSVITRESQFSEIGRAARETVLTRYSFMAHRETYVDFVRRASGAV